MSAEEMLKTFPETAQETDRNAALNENRNEMQEKSCYNIR